jgi:dihydroxyacetone kinase
MTHVYNAEQGFKDEFLEGLTRAYGRYLRRVPGASAVMAIDAPAAGEVSVIIGGGSGHYPAFAGLVGPGGCHGAVVGDVFTSPSSEQAYRAIRALDGGAGVLLSFGNYSGDVMQFGLAAERARAEGIDVRIVLVTDDVVSAPRERAQDRRGIAGGFWVFRAAAAAARRGDSLDAVERIAQVANSRTFTFGVAFDGCTFPGRTEPLFRVEPGRMALGLGIHGEPGIDVVDWMPATQLADVLIDQVLPERPEGATRARLLLNGLGATKYEELFVLYGPVADRLATEGVELVDPEVGEFVTSLDMAGCSLTLCWLTDELEPLLSGAMATPGFRSGDATALGAEPARERKVLAATSPVVRSGPSRATGGPTDADPAAQVVRAAFEAMARAIAGAEAELGRLDAVAGDGDHGAGMERGMRAAVAAAATAGPGAADVLQAAGVAFGDAAGGASGALWGSGLLAAARSLRGSGSVDTRALAAAVEAALDAVVSLGGAAPGDKTLVDALVPFHRSLAAAEAAPLADAWRSAAAAATEVARETARLPGRKGRAATHGDHSIGTPDPGATSLAIAVTAAVGPIERGCRSGPPGT